MPDNSFQKLAETAQQINHARAKDAKISMCAGYFRDISTDENLNRAVQFLGEGAFPSRSGKQISIGSSTYSTCAAKFCEIDYEKVFKPCKTVLGNASEAIEKLMENIETARQKRRPTQLSLRQIEMIYYDLYLVSSRAEKQNILWETWTQMTPVEIKYFIRIMRRGSLRIGLETNSVVTAIAEAFDKNPDDVRYAHIITGSIGRTAVLCKNGNLDEASLKLFHPLPFMLASSIGDRAIKNWTNYIAEEKFDGMRAQAHISGQKVKLFARNFNNITHSFPDIVQFFLTKELPKIVLDGEICVYKDNKILPFQLLKKRMTRKKPTQKIIDKYPVLFISYDLLYHNAQPAFELPLSQRRNLLTKLSEKYHLPIANQFKITDHNHLDILFERALARGNEGLILKEQNSAYEYGQRSKSWLKVKKPAGTLDTVIMYAHLDNGKSGSHYSNFTLGISVKDDERYEEEFIPIGKTCDSCTDEEMKQLNERIKELVVEKYGPTLGLIPEIMVELEFDDIQTNNRTKANYSLQLPRLKAIRWDLSPNDANTLQDVEQMYQQYIEQPRLKQDKNPSFNFDSSS